MKGGAMDTKMIRKFLIGGLLLLVWLEFLENPDSRRLRNALWQSLGFIA
jgi:hypothetical protein